MEQRETVSYASKISILFSGLAFYRVFADANLGYFLCIRSLRAKEILQIAEISSFLSTNQMYM